MPDPSTLDDFFFDLNGYLVIKNAVEPELVAAVNGAIDALPPLEYGPGDIVRRVGDGGRISIKGHKLRVGKALIGQDVALRPRAQDDGSFDVYFCHHRLEPIELIEDC